MLLSDIFKVNIPDGTIDEVGNFCAAQPQNTSLILDSKFDTASNSFLLKIDTSP